jgi:excisionase family DNA binding protein
VTDATPSSAPASYSTAEVARRLGVSIPTVQRWVDLGHLKAWKTVGGHRRIEAESAERMFRAQGAEQAAAPLMVMVVDDNPDDRDLLSALVETALPGAELSTANNGFQALVAIGQRVPDVLITDILMPHMNGVEMLRQLSAHCVVRPRLILAMSSQHPEQFAPLGSLPDGVGFVPKPIDPTLFMLQLKTGVDSLDH